jgi:hypothetical protein
MEWYLYPVHWWMTAAEWIEAHPNWALLLLALTGVLALVF